MRAGLQALAGFQAEEEGDLDEVGRELCERVGGVGCLRSYHDEAQRMDFSRFGGRSW